jgi:hypothetical protein
MRKFVKVRFASISKEVRASGEKKEVERDLTWNWLLVGNSNYLNGDVGITCGDYKLGKQITVFIIWFAFLCSCFPIRLSTKLP